MSDVEAAVEQLRVRFRARAAANLGDLRRWSQDPVANAAELHSIVHRLAGAAGTFGFHRLSDLAAKAEDMLVTDAPDPSAAIADVLEELERVSDPR